MPDDEEARQEVTDELLARHTEEYAAWLNGLTPEKRARHFRNADYWDAWVPRMTVRCATCGEAALEMKYPDRTVWRCLEETCGHEWEYRP